MVFSTIKTHDIFPRWRVDAPRRPPGGVGTEKMRGQSVAWDLRNSVPTQVSRGSPRKPKVLRELSIELLKVEEKLFSSKEHAPCYQNTPPAIEGRESES